MEDLVIRRLEYFGYKVSHNDLYIIRFLTEKVGNLIKIDCNISDIPGSLKLSLVDNVVGRFLLEKKTIDPKSLEFIDLETPIKQIQEGDTNITFTDAAKTPEQILDELINHLISKEIDFSCYRKIRW